MNKDEIVQRVTTQAQKDYPEFKGIKPQVRWTQNPNNTLTCSLTFQKTAKTATGTQLPRRLKVVADADGKIIKISSSK